LIIVSTIFFHDDGGVVVVDGDAAFPSRTNLGFHNLSAYRLAID
jgi:hypothetical protein